MFDFTEKSSEQNGLDKTFVFLDLNILELNTNRNIILYSMPSPSIYLSFIVNILLKTRLTINFNEIECLIGVEKFNYVSEKQSAIVKNEDKKSKSQILFKNKANLKVKICFSFISNELDFDIIKDKLNLEILKNRLSGGFIDNNLKIKVFSNKNSDLAKKMLIPSFILVEEPLEFNSLNEFVKEIQGYNNKELVSAGKNFISIKESFNHDKYEEVFGEEIFGAISLKAISSTNFNEFKSWRFKSTDNYILATTKGE